MTIMRLGGATYNPDWNAVSGNSLILNKMDENAFKKYGEIYVGGINHGIVLAAQDTYYQVDAWSAGFGVNGESLDATPDKDNDHIVIGTTGIYLVYWNVACYSVQKNEFEFEVFINNGNTAFPNTEIYRTTSVTSAVASLSGNGLCSLAANDTVELWVERKDGEAISKTVTIRAVTLGVKRIA